MRALDTEDVFPDDSHVFECKRDRDYKLRVIIRWHELPRSAKPRTKLFRSETKVPELIEEPLSGNAPPIAEIARGVASTFPGIFP